MRAVVLALVLSGIGLGLASCGKKGPPSPPGPSDQVIFPRNYPVVTPGPPPAVSPTAQWPFGLAASPKQP